LQRKGGINSLETGLRLAALLASAGGALALKDLAAAARMPPPKAHRYLVSLIRAGLAEQDADSGRYRLGPLALDLGLAALNSMDVLRLGGEAVVALRAEIDETVMLTVWGNRGPVVVRWEESSHPIATNVRAGWVMPLTSSATGRLFCALLPAAMTAPLLRAELARRPAERARHASRMKDIQARRLSRVEGDLQRGIAGVAAPVFSQGGAMAAALTAVGPQGAIVLDWEGSVVQAVRRAAQRLSARLGHTASLTGRKS